MSLPKPYYKDDAVTIYHADCRDILPQLPKVDLVLTDPPYGLGARKKGTIINKRLGKNEYNSFEDTPDNVKKNVVPGFKMALKLAKRAVLTPGPRCLGFYPMPADLGVIFQPASAGASPWGHPSGQPIYYYGKDPYPRLFRKTSWLLTEAPPKNGHPCPKPFVFWNQLLERSSKPGELVLDPFMGSGTTLRAAKDLGRKAIGIELEEKYCEIAARRMAQEVLL